MKKIAIITLAAIGLVGCSTTNKQQIIDSTSGDGVEADATIPVTQSVSVGMKLFVGRFNHTTGINPTSTNQLYSASAAVAVGGSGKQSVAANSTTNANGSITDGSRDGSVIILGHTSAQAGGSPTNGTISAQGN